MSTTVSTPPQSERKLSDVARHLLIPEGVTTTVYARVKPRLAQMGVSFDRWQDGFGSVALGCRDDGKFAATVGGVVASIPRQVGKTFTVGHLLIALCLELPGLRVVWTSHHNRTTTNTFRSMQGMVRRRKVWPHIAPNGIRTANGEQEIKFANGSIIMFGAREHGFGRGMDAIDVLVFDEAQILSLKALEDMVPSTNQARNPHGALVFFIGTPPRPTDDGEAFTAKRTRALAGDAEDMMYVEIGADPDADLDDREVWAQMNPSYPHRTPAESMLRMRENIPDDDSWRREAMGIWDVVGASSVIDPITWHDRADPASMAIERLSLAVAVSPDRLVSTVAFAGQRADGLWHIEVDEQRSGTAWILEHVAKRCERNEIRAVVIDGASQALSLVDDLQARKIRTTVTGLRDLATACGGLFDAVSEGTVRHIDQPLLNASNGAAGKRSVFSGEAWVWTGKHSALDITPTQAVTLALWGAQNSNVKRPTRKKAGGRRVVTS